MNTCRGCGAEIRWIVMQSGKKMPVEPVMITIAEREKGSRTGVTEDGRVIRGERASEGTACYAPHWANCPAMGRFKKAK